MTFQDTLSHRTRVRLETRASARRSRVSVQKSRATTPTLASGATSTTASGNGEVGEGWEALTRQWG